MARKNTPTTRLRALRRLKQVAVQVGKLVENGELGSMGVAMMKAERDKAKEAGCLGEDVDTVTMDGLCEGRCQ